MTLGMLGRWVAVAAGGAFAALALVMPGGAAAEVGLEPVGTYSDPVYVTSDPDDPERLFIVERAGVIRLTTPGGTTEFADLTSVVLANDQERGLLSIAFPDDHAETGLLYVAYTDQNNGGLQVAELEVDGDGVDLDSLRLVLRVPSPFANHNAGQLQFGPDGYLYISTGDGGSGGDPEGHGQNLTTLLGGILRIDPRQAGTQPYSIPADNPFADPEDRPVEDAKPEIWSWGLRNPWRFSFDRETGALTIGDVGQQQREEINYRPQEVGGGHGDNFGWNCREGLIAYGSPSPNCAITGPDYTDPVFDYPHSGGPPSGCSITGGYVVRDSSLPDLYGRYLYADYCVGQLRSIDLDDPGEDRLEGLAVGLPGSFGEDACGRVYVASRSNGVVSRLVGDTEPECDLDDPPPVDDEAPVTTLSIDGAPPEPEYDGPVEVMLSASDLPGGEDASGVAHIDYRLSEGSIEGDWVRVTNDAEHEPFETSFTVSPFDAEAASIRRRSPVVFFYELEYRATDFAGNIEELRSTDFAITIYDPPVDDEAPVTTLSIDGAPPEPDYDGPVEVTLSASDLPEGEDASGVAEIHYRLSESPSEGDWVEVTNDGGDDPFETSFTVSPLDAEEASVQRQRSPVIFFYELEYRAIDAAGNLEELRSADFAITVGAPQIPLQLTTNPKRRKVGPRKRGVRFIARLTNPGPDTGPVRLCAQPPPRRLRVRGPRCRTFAALPAGETRRHRIRLKIRRPARGKLTRLRLVASGSDIVTRQTVARVRVRR